LSIYFSGEGQPHGCFAIGTATTEAVEDSEIRDVLSERLTRLDTDLETRLRAAIDSGELKGDVDPAANSSLPLRISNKRSCAMRHALWLFSVKLRIARYPVNEKLCGGLSRRPSVTLRYGFCPIPVGETARSPLINWLARTANSI